MVDESIFAAPGDREKLESKSEASFCVIALDETKDWTLSPEFKEAIDEIWGVYMFDESIQFHMGDTNGLFGLAFLYNSIEFKEDVDEELQAEIHDWIDAHQNGSEDKNISVRVVENLVKSYGDKMFRFYRSPKVTWDPAEETYNEITERYYEQFTANHVV